MQSHTSRRQFASRPDYVSAFLYRGRAYEEKGDYDQAIADFTEAIRLNANDEPDGLVSAYFSRGIVYAYKGHFDNAIADCNEIIRLEPTSTASFNDRGYVYYVAP